MTAHRLSVVICTWNRCVLLDRALGHLARARPPRSAWEIVVVDNNCTDRTAEVVDRWADRLPVRRVREPEPGLSHARNRGLDAVSGDMVLFIDDDIAVVPDWFTAYEAAFDRDPHAAVFGGPIHAAFEGQPPQWLREAWSTVAIIYGECSYEDAEAPLRALDRLPFGGNFALRLSALEGLRFDPRLGRKPSGEGALGEESAFFAKLFERGCEGRWVPHAAVAHWIPREKQTLGYLRRQYELYGKTCLVRDHPDHGASLVGRWPAWLLQRVAAREARYRLARLSGRPRDWVEPLTESATAWGMLKFCRGRL